MPGARMPLLDRLAIGLSGLCVAHCVATVVLVSVLSVGGELLADPAIHRIGLALAVALGVVALGQGWRRHGRRTPAIVGVAGLALMATGLIAPHGAAEAAVTVMGVALLAAGHLANARAVR